MQTLAGIEDTVRGQLLEHVGSEIGVFYRNEQRHAPWTPPDAQVNYAYYQAEGIPIDSGSVESTVKQIGRRIKISGAEWERRNVPQVLKQRSAYLHGQFSK